MMMRGIRFFSPLFTLAFLLGCGGGEVFVREGVPFQPDTTPPSVLNPRLRHGGLMGTSLTIPASAGRVTIEATVTDPSGVALVRLRVERVGDPSFRSELPLTISPEGQVIGTVDLPFNNGPGDQVYIFVLFVQDNSPNKNGAEIPIGTVTVHSPLSGIPPLPDPGGIGWGD